MEDFVEAMNNKQVPLMVRRCIARVYPQMTGTKENKFAAAVQICTWTFQTHGFVRKKSRTYVLNSKGVQRNKYHQRRKDARKYEDLFNRLYNTIFDPKKASKLSKKVVELGKEAREAKRRSA